jgi:hypothetical protein
MKTLLLFCLLSLVASCGPSSKQKTVSATFGAVNVAREAFRTYDNQVQAAIVDDAQTLEEGKAALAAWREKRDRVVRAFESAYYAIALAATDLSDHNLADMLAAFAVFRATYKDVTGKDP